MRKAPLTDEEQAEFEQAQIIFDAKMEKKRESLRDYIDPCGVAIGMFCYMNDKRAKAEE